jgi:hypothetical protein
LKSEGLLLLTPKPLSGFGHEPVKYRAHFDNLYV